MTERPCVFLVDGSATIYRAYHALPNLSNSAGLPTNATYGFTALLLKLVQEFTPRYLGIVFDVKGPTFRHELYEDYKATRPGMPEDLARQIPYIKEIVKGLGIASLELQGFEADDVIGTLARSASAQRIDCVIVSGDKDFCQILDEYVTLLDPRSSTRVGPREAESRYGVSPDRVVEVFGLSGDATDNVPGVKGIGLKTAIKLMQDYQSIANLYAHLDEVHPASLRSKLAQGEESARLSRELVTINTNLPIPFDLDQLRVRTPDPHLLEPIFRELEFSRFLKEFIPHKIPDHKIYKLVHTEEAFCSLLLRLTESTGFAVHLHTAPVGSGPDRLVGVALALDPHQAFYVPLDDAAAGIDHALDRAQALKGLKPLFEDQNLKKVWHNLKPDYRVLAACGIQLRGIAGDTMVASYLLNPAKRNHSLPDVALEHLHHQLSLPQPTPNPEQRKHAEPSLRTTGLWEGNCEQADVIFLLSRLLFPTLQENNLAELFDRIEMPLIMVLAKMEEAGVKIDPALLSDFSRHLEGELKHLEEKIYGLAGLRFNINSPQQLSEVLFEKLRLPSASRTKTGYSTNVEVLNKLAKVHELPGIVLTYRSLAKLKSTYLDVLPRLVNPATGRVHTTFNQTSTVTGRLSSSDPNLQNIPIRGEWGEKIRRAFVAEKGHLLVSSDYSQVELRIMAHLSGDRSLLQAFREDQDIHALTAAELFQVSPEAVTPAMRREAKVVNFGIIYGMSSMGLAQELGIARSEAEAYIATYFATYQGVKDYIDATLAKGRHLGYVTTLSGRVRHLPELRSSNRTAREFAERAAINAPIQGTAADLIKKAMITIDQRIADEKLDARMILQIHDELLFEVSETDRDKLLPLVKEAMEGAMQLDVPIKVTIGYGENWERAH
jgi:DNA polymerase I